MSTVNRVACYYRSRILITYGVWYAVGVSKGTSLHAEAVCIQ